MTGCFRARGAASASNGGCIRITTPFGRALERTSEIFEEDLRRVLPADFARSYQIELLEKKSMTADHSALRSPFAAKME
jgi:hypothetical protein